MYPPRRTGSRRRTRLAEFADAARACEWEEITPTDVADDRLFYQKKTWQKLVVMAGGPLMNLLIAFVLLLRRDRPLRRLPAADRPSPTSSSASSPTPPAPSARPPTRQSPAAQAGLQVGDRVSSFNGVADRPTTPSSAALIRANLDGEARLVVERDGATRRARPPCTP